MKTRRKKHEPNTEPVTEPFFSKEKKGKTSGGSGSFFQQAPAVQRKLADGGSRVIQLAPEDGKDAGTGGTKDAGAAKAAGAPDAGPAPFSVSTIKKEYVATVFAEAVAGQETDIAWIYYNLITKENSIKALSKSAAFSLKSDNFKIAMTALGDLTFAADAPTDKWLKDVKAPTIKDYVDNNAYFKTNAGPRIKKIESIIDGIIADPKTNPYPGWTGQGNLNDFNNISQPKSTYWKMARAYFWMQEKDPAVEKLVKAIGEGKNMQFIFNGKKIEEFFKTHDVPADVPIFTPAKKP